MEVYLFSDELKLLTKLIKHRIADLEKQIAVCKTYGTTMVSTIEKHEKTIAKYEKILEKLSKEEGK